MFPAYKKVLHTAHQPHLVKDGYSLTQNTAAIMAPLITRHLGGPQKGRACRDSMHHEAVTINGSPLQDKGLSHRPPTAPVHSLPPNFLLSETVSAFKCAFLFFSFIPLRPSVIWGGGKHCGSGTRKLLRKEVEMSCVTVRSSSAQLEGGSPLMATPRASNG